MKPNSQKKREVMPSFVETKARQLRFSSSEKSFPQCEKTFSNYNLNDDNDIGTTGCFDPFNFKLTKWAVFDEIPTNYNDSANLDYDSANLDFDNISFSNSGDKSKVIGKKGSYKRFLGKSRDKDFHRREFFHEESIGIAVRNSAFDETNLPNIYISTTLPKPTLPVSMEAINQTMASKSLQTCPLDDTCTFSEISDSESLCHQISLKQLLLAKL